jgi:hypothetical protein
VSAGSYYSGLFFNFPELGFSLSPPSPDEFGVGGEVFRELDQQVIRILILEALSGERREDFLPADGDPSAGKGHGFPDGLPKEIKDPRDMIPACHHPNGDNAGILTFQIFHELFNLVRGLKSVPVQNDYPVFDPCVKEIILHYPDRIAFRGTSTGFSSREEKGDNRDLAAELERAIKTGDGFELQPVQKFNR